MKIKLARYIILVMLCTAVLASAAYPASFVYSSQQKRISAGVLSGCGYNLPALAPWTPYMFYIMEQRLDIKPAGWEFYNPLAPSMQSDGAGNYTKVTKDMPAYWRVDIGSPLSDLMKMDVLLIPAQGALSFERNQREKLRKYVDGGGTLIIDNQGGGTFPTVTNEFFIDEVQFYDTGVSSAPALVPNLSHPLVRRPFSLNWEDVNKIGDLNTVGKRYISNFANNSSPNQIYFASIITAAGGVKPVASAAQYGSGHIVVTTGIGRAICEPVGTTGGICNKMFMIAQSEDLKFAYNIVNWGSEHTTFHKNARHSGYSFAEIGLPLVPMWEYDLTKLTPPQPVNPTGSSPAILDDMVFYVDGNGILHAFDLTSTTDRDTDGSSDDGEFRDSSQGAPYDEIWQVDVGEASSPTVGYVAIGGGMAEPVIFITKQTGSVVGFKIRDYYTPGNPVTYRVPAEIPVLIGMVAFSSATDIPAPTFVDGTVYVGDGEGRLWAGNVISGSTWQSPVTGSPTTGCPAAGSPIVGCVRDSGTGAVDQVVYQARKGIPDTTNGDIQSFPIRVFNEVLRRGPQQPDPPGPANTWSYQTRVANSSRINSDPATYNIYYLDASGNLVDFPDPVTFLAPSTFQLTFTTVPPGTAIVADYELDPVTPPGINARATTGIKVAHDVPTTGDGIVSTPALGENDILYFGTSNGSLYAMRETGHGRVQSRIEWRWYLGDPAPKALLGGNMGTVVGSPAVTNDKVYFAVNAGGDGYILAFDNDPSFVLDLGLAPGARIDRSKGVKLVQFDSMTNQEMEPISCGTSDNSSATVDFDSGKITINNFRTSNNTHKDLSASQNITVFYYLEGDDANELQSVHPSNANDKWNNLVWCVKIPGKAVSSSPMVIGDVLYVGLANGALAVMDVEKVRANIISAPLIWDLANVYWKDKGWEEPIMGGGAPILTTVAGSNGIMAVSTAAGLAVYHNPATLVSDGNRLIEHDSSGNLLWSCEATTGYVTSTNAGEATMAYGATKVPFNRAAVAKRASVGGIIVADTGNNRVVHIDSSGKILWEITGFVDPGPLADPNYPNAPQLPAGTSLSLNRPMDVSMWDTPGTGGYPEYHYLIADSGNYRVVEVVARYSTVTGTYRNELEWTSKTTTQGKQYRFTSAKRILDPTMPNQVAVCCTISNYSADNVNPEGPGGVLARINMTTGLIEAIRITVDGLGGTTYNLYNPTFFDRIYRSQTEYSDVVVDAGGIHVTVYDDTGAVTAYRSYTAQQYFAATPLGKPLSVSSVQLLPNGNLLVANKATGTLTGGAAFFGEVFELLPNGASYDYVAPTGGGSGAYEARQPLSAERLPY